MEVAEVFPHLTKGEYHSGGFGACDPRRGQQCFQRSNVPCSNKDSMIHKNIGKERQNEKEGEKRRGKKIEREAGEGGGRERARVAFNDEN